MSTSVDEDGNVDADLQTTLMTEESEMEGGKIKTRETIDSMISSLIAGNAAFLEGMESRAEDRRAKQEQIKNQLIELHQEIAAQQVAIDELKMRVQEDEERWDKIESILLQELVNTLRVEVVKYNENLC